MIAVDRRFSGFAGRALRALKVGIVYQCSRNVAGSTAGSTQRCRNTAH